MWFINNIYINPKLLRAVVAGPKESAALESCSFIYVHKADKFSVYWRK